MSMMHFTLLSTCLYTCIASAPAAFQVAADGSLVQERYGSGKLTPEAERTKKESETDLLEDTHMTVGIEEGVALGESLVESGGTKPAGTGFGAGVLSGLGLKGPEAKAREERKRREMANLQAAKKGMTAEEARAQAHVWAQCKGPEYFEMLGTQLYDCDCKKYDATTLALLKAKMKNPEKFDMQHLKPEKCQCLMRRSGTPGALHPVDWVGAAAKSLDPICRTEDNICQGREIQDYYFEDCREQ